MGKRKIKGKRPIKSTADLENESDKKEKVISDYAKSAGLRLSWIKFIDEYIKNGGNGTEAYMSAYPESSKEAAKSSASDLLTNPNILEEINNKLGAQKVTEEFIVDGLRSIAVDYRGAKTIMAAVKSYEILGKMKGMLVDTKKIAFTGDNPALFPALVKQENKEKWDKETSRISE